jgi:hypothetical protein
MLTPRLDRIYSLFERLESFRAFTSEFERLPGPVPDFLPLDYRIFVSAPRRTLPADWELFFFYSRSTISLQAINAQMREEGLPDNYVIFGKTGDEDFLIFHDRAVHWCDADSLASLPSDQPFAPSFSDAILKMIQLRLTDIRQQVETFDTEFRALTDPTE